jgi:hypothetical protein
MVGLHLLGFFDISLVDRVYELGANLADGSL